MPGEGKLINSRHSWNMLFLERVVWVVFFLLMPLHVWSECEYYVSLERPFFGEVITVGPGATGVWTQSWTLSINNGLTCTGSFVAGALLAVQGTTSPVFNFFYLPTGVTTIVQSWPEFSYSTLTPQIASLVMDVAYAAESLSATLFGTFTVTTVAAPIPTASSPSSTATSTTPLAPTVSTTGTATTVVAPTSTSSTDRGLSGSDKIALGCGLGIPLAALIVAILTWCYPKRNSGYQP